MRLYLIRHAQAQNNVHHIIGGNDDYQITEFGKNQIELLKQNMPEVSRIYCSNLIRAKQTAKAVGLKLGIIPKVCKELEEIDFGSFKGLTFEQTQELYPKQYNTWVNDWHNFVAPNGESIKQVKKRVRNFIKTININKNGEDIAIVAHQIVIRAILCELFDFDNINIKVENTKMIVLDIDEMGTRIVF